MRAPYQTLIFPFIKEKDKYLYAIFKRRDLKFWQGVSGGGEDGEKPIDTAKRECFEEAQINTKSEFIKLSSITTIPAEYIRGKIWGKDVIMVPEFSFGVELQSKKIEMSDEHTEYIWLSIEDAINKLHYDSNKSAIWELNQRLINNGLDGVKENDETIIKFLIK